MEVKDTRNPHERLDEYTIHFLLAIERYYRNPTEENKTELNLAIRKYNFLLSIIRDL